MPLAPREIDAIFSACDVTATLPCMSDLPIQTHQASPSPHRAPPQPPDPPTHHPYQVDGNGSIDWTEFAAAFRDALQESPFRQGDFWKGG